MVISDWDAGDTTLWTPGAGAEVIDSGTPAGQFSYMFLQRSAADGVSGVSTSISVSGLAATGEYHFSLVEVVPDLALANPTSSATDAMLDPGRQAF
jgi:hypothetical protein